MKFVYEILGCDYFKHQAYFPQDHLGTVSVGCVTYFN